MPHLSDGLIQVLQLGTVLLVSPLVTGVIARAEAIVQMRRGPRLLQPYYDIGKFFRKETVLPEGAGPIFRAAPYVSFACYCVVPLLIPVLTSFPPQASYLGDILGGGFILGLASYAVSLAAIDSGSPYAQLGSSRLRTFGALGEPTILFVIFTVALITGTDLPYVFAAMLKSSAAEIVRPAHLLAAAAFFTVVLAENRPHSAGESWLDARVRADRGGANARAFRSRLRVALETRITPSFEAYLYSPLVRAGLWLSAQARRSQSGRLGTYLHYILVVLIAALALIPALNR